MKFVFDMVHHNPGEPPFATAFSQPAKLVEYGYNGQVFKHINCIATFEAFDKDIFPEGSPDKAWIDDFSQHIVQEIAAAKAAGLEVYFHVDLFVLPTRLVDKYRDQLCDQNGRISIHKPLTLEVHRVMFDELTRRFPEVDGYIIRVGETYLYDTPYHCGNAPIPWKRGTRQDEQAAYVALLQFLREQVCVRNGRRIFFRTWDLFPDRIHATAPYYLEVSNQIEPHENLYFSIKHTTLDFWRYMKFNECLTAGRHKQVVEVQCQREYEGKGAYPDYFMHGVIDSFEENAVPKGLRDIINHPLVAGIFTWTRGGGWYGPYITNEFWPDLNAYVIAQWAMDTSRSEESIFMEYMEDKLGLSVADAERFREISLLSARAVLLGRYCGPYDRADEGRLPNNLWMRDDRLGGLKPDADKPTLIGQLDDVFEYLRANNGFDEALAEKRQCVELWQQMKKLFSQITTLADSSLREQIAAQIEYGLRLFGVIDAGWQIMVMGYVGDKASKYNTDKLAKAIGEYDRLWKHYNNLPADAPCCATLYKDIYFATPGTPQPPGLGATVERYRERLVSCHR